MLTQGQLVLRCFGCPPATLAGFTDKRANTHGLIKSQIDQDLKDKRAVQKALGAGSTVGMARPTGGAQGRGSYGA